MKITIQPTRNVSRRWVPCTFDEAQAYELRSRRGKRLARVASLKEAKRLAALLDSNHSPRRSPSARLGARYASIREEVAARRPKVIARSLTEQERAKHGLSAMGTIFD